ncbi:hypothetical protein AXA44_11765 [Rhodococcus sp. SC4]|nr:hypothetical protein AXA44_11765 [Rhodococcus sp. SC4]RZL84026.1 MAG: LysR family transcriptional regulator [Rhodococcus sp. (in: high G+C Gram-positive bacteria)]
MDKRFLVHFLAVVDEGSISAAARRLQLSQPSVSNTIQELENELGCKLFTRGRGMSLTAGGRALVGPARAALRALDAARWAIEEISELQSGELEIGCVVNRAIDPLSGLIARYRERHPGINIRVRTVPIGVRGFDDLARGNIELLLTETPPAATGFQMLSLGECEVLAVLPPGSRFPDRPFRLEDLIGRDWISGPFPGTAGRSHLNGLLAARGLPYIDSVVETAHRQMVLPLILAGVGGGILPSGEAELAERLGAVVRSFDANLPTGHAIYYRSDDPSPAAQAFLAVARESRDPQQRTKNIATD